jgi:pimeloyl-ACP methyl ester carboxylesterase
MRINDYLSDIQHAIPAPVVIEAADLDVERIGSGPPVVLVHGSIVDARRTWRKQYELADRWSLCLPNRPGFAASPPLERNDFEPEAPMIAELLDGGAHLIGHSYGAVLALLAAAQRPGAVRSLVISEPGCFNLAKGDPAVDEVIEHGNRLYANGDVLSAPEFLRLFREGVHSAHETPDELPDWLEHGAKLVARERPPWEADVPLDVLAAAEFPKLVISGGHSEAFDRLCDVLATAIGAERAVLPGRGHTIPSLGEPYNALVDRFMASAELRTAGREPPAAPPAS